MKNGIKDLRRIEREIRDNFRGDLPVLVMDTGGLIDIEAKVRQHNFTCVNEERIDSCISTTYFLQNILKGRPMFITPKTYREIRNHEGMKLNGHVYELSPSTLNFSLDSMVYSTQFFIGLNQRVESDQIRYDAYWAARECCKDNPKKYAEGCSDTDKEILLAIANLSNSNPRNAPQIGVGSVVVVSSDSHVINGSEILKTEFDGRYSGIFPVSTRCRFRT